VLTGSLVATEKAYLTPPEVPWTPTAHYTSLSNEYAWGQEDSRVHLHQSTSNWMKIRRAFGFFSLILSSAAWRCCFCQLFLRIRASSILLSGSLSHLRRWEATSHPVVVCVCFAFCFNSPATRSWSGLPFLGVCSGRHSLYFLAMEFG
jgi:hypothetical protein